MPGPNMTGFVKLRRGLVSHFKKMTTGEIALFVTYLLLTHWTGKKKGCCLFSNKQIAKLLNWTPGTVQRHRRDLRRRGFIRSHRGKMGVFVPKYDTELPSNLIEASIKNDRSGISNMIEVSPAKRSFFRRLGLLKKL